MLHTSGATRTYDLHRKVRLVEEGHINQSFQLNITFILVLMGGFVLIKSLK